MGACFGRQIRGKTSVTDETYFMRRGRPNFQNRTVGWELAGVHRTLWGFMCDVRRNTWSWPLPSLSAAVDAHLTHYVWVSPRPPSVWGPHCGRQICIYQEFTRHGPRQHLRHHMQNSVIHAMLCYSLNTCGQKILLSSKEHFRNVR